MAQSIWVLAEQWRGKISEATYEVLALGREMADALGAPLEAVLLGDKVKDSPDRSARRTPSSSSIIRRSPTPVPRTYGERWAGWRSKSSRGRSRSHDQRVVGHRRRAPRPAEMPFVNFCENVEASGGKLRAKCLLYGGKMQATMAPAGAAIFGIMPGARRPKRPGREEPGRRGAGDRLRWNRR